MWDIIEGNAKFICTMNLVPPKDVGSIVHLGTWHYAFEVPTIGTWHENIGIWHENIGTWHESTGT